jgi:hypothetical protein
MMKHLMGIGAAIAVTGVASSAMALTVSTGATADDLVNEILGGGTTYSNVTQTGSGVSFGTFSDGTDSIGIDSGILITSGSAALAAGPNNGSGTGLSTGGAGLAELTALSGVTTYDAATLSFDFTTESGDIFFEYVFGSDEYNEYVGSQYNDVFAFFINGVNVALIPGTSTPVAINNVNNGSNSAYYVDNEAGPYNVEYDGFTTVLTASALGLGAGTHTITLAIADSGDSILDSGVFIKAGSFSPTPPTAVPELSATALGSVAMLLMFGALALNTRRRSDLGLVTA